MSVNLALSNYNAQMAYTKMSEFVNSFSRPIIAKSTTYEGITDSVKLSPQSLQAFARNWINQQLGSVASNNENNEYKSTEQISREYAEDLAGFASLTGQIFTKNEIKINSPVALQSDGLGRVVQVNRDRGDSAKVDAALKESPVLVSEFMRIAAKESIMSKTKENPEFIEDYLRNPAKTLKDYEGSLREYMLKFQIHLSDRMVSTGQGEPIYL